MDRDSFVERHAPSWDRLADLSSRGHLRPDESDELVRLYLRASSHLATARRRYADPQLLLHLNTLVARANARVYGTRSRTWQGVKHAVLRTFPAAVWEMRRAIVLSTVVFVVVFAATTAWIATSPAALDVAIPPEVRASLASGLRSEPAPLLVAEARGRPPDRVLFSSERVRAVALGAAPVRAHVVVEAGPGVVLDDALWNELLQAVRRAAESVAAEHGRARIQADLGAADTPPRWHVFSVDDA